MPKSSGSTVYASRRPSARSSAHDARAEDRELVHAGLSPVVVAVHDQRVLVADLHHHVADRSEHAARVHAAHAVRRVNRVRERGGDVERGAEADLAEDAAETAGVDGRAHAVEHADAGDVDAALHRRRVAVHVHAHGLEDVDRAAPRREGARAVPGEARALRRGDDRRRRAHVERLERVHAGAGVLDQRARARGPRATPARRAPCRTRRSPARRRRSPRASRPWRRGRRAEHPAAGRAARPAAPARNSS